MRVLRTSGLLVAFGLLVGGVLSPARGEEHMVEPRFREGSPGDVLVKGEPSLLRGHLDAFIDFSEAAFDLGWSVSVEQELRDALELAYGGWAADARRDFLALVTPLTGLREKGRSGDLEGLRGGVRAFWIALDRRIAAAPRDRAHKLLTDGLERRQRAVWKGIPAIQGSAADAWLETTLFLSTLGRNERFEPTDGQRQSLLEQLDTGLHGVGEPLRERLRLVHRTWLLVKSRWDQAPPARRFALRFAAVRLLARLLPAERTFTVVDGPQLSDYAREALKAAQRVEAFDAWSSLAHSPEPVLEALAKALELPSAGAVAAPEQLLLLR